MSIEAANVSAALCIETGARLKADKYNEKDAKIAEAMAELIAGLF